MKKNVGTKDQIIRFLIAFVVASLYLADCINIFITAVLLAILSITALFNFCPLYRLFRINTRRHRYGK